MAASGQNVIAGAAYVLIKAKDMTGRVLHGVAQRMKAVGLSAMAMGANFQRAAWQFGLMAAAMARPLLQSIGHAAEFEYAILNVKAVLKATDAEMVSLTKRVRFLGRTTSFTATEVAQAAEQLARGGFAKDEIENSLRSVLEFARAGKVDLTTAANAMVRSIRAFKMEAADADNVADAFFVAASSGVTSVQELTSALSFTANSAHNLGLDLADTLATLSQLSNQMLTGTKGGTAFNQLLLRMAQRADLVKEHLGFDPFDAEGQQLPYEQMMTGLAAGMKKMSPRDRSKILTDIFNVRGVRATTIVKELDKVFEVANRIRTEQGAAKEATDTIEGGLWGGIKRLYSAFDELRLSIGEAFKEPIKQLEEFIVTINGLAEWVKRNKEAVISLGKGVAVIIGLAAGLFAVGLAFKAIGIALIVPAFLLFKTLGLAVLLKKAFLAIFVANPLFGVMAVAIAGTTAALARFTEVGRDVTDMIKDDFVEARKDLSTTLDGIGDALKGGDLTLAAEIGLTGVELAFRRATKTIRTIWIEMNKALVRYSAVAAKAIVAGMGRVETAWQSVMAYYRTHTAGIERNFALQRLDEQRRTSGMSDREYMEERAKILETEGAAGAAANAEADKAIADINARTDQYIATLEEFATTTNSILDADIAAGDARIAELNGKLVAMRKDAKVRYHEDEEERKKREWEKKDEEAAPGTPAAPKMPAFSLLRGLERHTMEAAEAAYTNRKAVADAAVITAKNTKRTAEATEEIARLARRKEDTSFEAVDYAW